jgi:hypothetical protein
MQRAAALHAVPDVNAKSRVVVARLMPHWNIDAPGEFRRPDLLVRSQVLVLGLDFS